MRKRAIMTLEQKEAKNAYDRLHDKQPARKAALRAAARKYSASAKGKECSRRKRLANAEKIKATSAVAIALRAGTIERRPCTHCGSDMEVDGHHFDYARPLEVTWLCRRCHVALHVALRKDRG